MAETLLPISSPLNIRELVCYYHTIQPKCKYKEICSIITTHHSKHVTMSTVKRIYREEGLNRKRNVGNADLKEMAQVGYRQLTECMCLKYGINISKGDVRKTLREVDPDGVDAGKRSVIRRRVYQSHGPGHVYHIDGNDKLKRWGFCIHECVDGFSRKLLWLSVSSSNNNPLIIANFYLQCMKRYKRAPRLLRMDKGRENIYCKDLQVFFTGKDDSFLYAASTRNQCIEAYWSRLKKFRLNWWIDFFTEMVNQSLFCPQLITHEDRPGSKSRAIARVQLA